MRRLHRIRQEKSTHRRANAKNQLRRYRRYVHEAGALDRPDKDAAKVIDTGLLENEPKKSFEIRRMDRFRYRTRYFTDSGIIGTKEFVSINYQKFKNLFMSKKEKIPKPVSGLNGLYSLKRLSDKPISPR